MRIQPFMLLTLLALNFLVDLYIYKRLVLYYTQKKWIKCSYWIFNALILIGISATTYIIRHYSGQIGFSSLMWIFYAYLLFYVPKITYTCLSIFDFCFPKRHNRRIRFFSILGSICATTVFISMLYGTTYGRLHYTVTEEEIITDRLPASFDHYKIVQLSDLHLGNFKNGTGFITDIVKQVNELNPDLNNSLRHSALVSPIIGTPPLPNDRNLPRYSQSSIARCPESFVSSLEEGIWVRRSDD